MARLDAAPQLSPETEPLLLAWRDAQADRPHVGTMSAIVPMPLPWPALEYQAARYGIDDEARADIVTMLRAIDERWLEATGRRMTREAARRRQQQQQQQPRR